MSTKDEFEGVTQASPAAALEAASENIGEKPSGPPNGGAVAWFQVLGSFALFMNCWGIINSFGVFQTYYETVLLQGQVTSSDISWIGSIQSFLLVFVGVVTGPIFDRGYFRTLIALGSFLVVFGMMMTSLCTQYWQLILAQGLVVGLGSGCLFVPSVAIIPTYFTTKKALAQGLAASGSSIGGIIYPIIFHRTVQSVGFGWATRICGFVSLVSLLIPVLGMRVRTKATSARRLFDLAAWHEPPYVFFSIACFFGFMGLYVPFYYIDLYAIDTRIASAETAFYLVAVLNAGSFFGRIIPNFIADYTGPLNVIIVCITFCIVLAFAWMAVTNLGGIVTFAILYGFFSGPFVSLPPTTIVTLTPDMSTIGARMGMSFGIAAVGLLIGNPIGGILLGSGTTAKSWTPLIAWCGACTAAAAIFSVLARTAKVGVSLKAKA